MNNKAIDVGLIIEAMRKVLGLTDAKAQHQKIGEVNETWPTLPNRKVDITTPPATIGTITAIGSEAAKTTNVTAEATTDSRAKVTPNPIEARVESDQGKKVIGARKQLDLNAEGKGDKPWVNLFAGNRFATRGMSLSFIAPTIHNGEQIVELQLAEIEKGTEKCI